MNGGTITSPYLHGVALFWSGPREFTFVLATSDTSVPSGIYWMPSYRLLGVAPFVTGLIVLLAATALAAGLRKGNAELPNQ